MYFMLPAIRTRSYAVRDEVTAAYIDADEVQQSFAQPRHSIKKNVRILFIRPCTLSKKKKLLLINILREIFQNGINRSRKNKIKCTAMLLSNANDRSD